MALLRSIAQSPRTFPTVVAVTVVAALMPAGWVPLRAVVNVPAEVLDVMTMPLQFVGERVSETVRRSPSEYPDLPDDEATARLMEDLEKFRLLARQLEFENELMRNQIEELQGVPMVERSAATRRIIVPISGRTMNMVHGPVDLRATASMGVVPGTVAVWGNNLLGRVTDSTSVKATLQPITSPVAGSLIVVGIIPADNPDIAVEDIPRVQLTATGSGTLQGDADHLWNIAVNDRAFVFAESDVWRDAQGFFVGTVTDVRTKDEQPLRNVITITPNVNVHELSKVVLLISDDDVTEAAP